VGAPFDRLLRAMPTLLVTVYNTPHPHRGLSPLYTLHAEIYPDATDPKKCWVVMEKFGYWDAAEPDPKIRFKNAVNTLSPTDPVRCLTIEEAHEFIKKQVLLRASQGFKYLFTLDPFGAPWYKRYEVLPDGSWREMLV
jgi:hypothetical protein